jgi:GMP synthase PP-ATPase subunit
MSINDTSLENRLQALLRHLEEVNDSVAPTNLRHHISDVVVSLRRDIKTFNQEDHEQVINYFNPEVDVAQKYITMLEDMNVTRKQSTSDMTSYSHLLWMLYEIVLNSYMSHTKKNRWLGYVQGCLVKDGIISVDTEREATRDIFNGR